MNWQDEFIGTLVSNGFLKGKASPYKLFHLQTELCVTVHGDDFTSTGATRQFTWFKGLLDKTYECTHQWLGPDSDEELSIRVFNRVICWDKDNITYETDGRHVEVLLHQSQLDAAKAVTSPGTREEQSTSHETISEDMKPEEASRYRMLVARLDYLASDRPDIQYAVKEASKTMAKPQMHHWSLLKRAGKYLIDAPRVIQRFKWQRVMNTVSGDSDFDWAGDQTIRKSTSGGVCRIGPHVIKTWSSTQQMIAFSSAEAELYALLKCACQILGIMNLALDFGIQLRATVHIDASAALATSQRQGLGQFRHIDVYWLWFQENIKNGNIKANKVNGKDNPADLMIKHLPGPEIIKHVQDLEFEVTKGRADKSMALNGLARGHNEDCWTTDSQCTIRQHNVPNRSLCDQVQCVGAPKLGSLTITRATHGVFSDGTKFMRQDNWTCKSTKRLDMGGWCTGRTVVVQKKDKRNVVSDGLYKNETRTQLLIRKWQGILRQHPPRKEDSLQALAAKKSGGKFYESGMSCGLYMTIDSGGCRSNALIPPSLDPSGLHKAGVKTSDSAVMDESPLWALQGFCARPRVVTSPMPGRYPLPSVFKVLAHSYNLDCGMTRGIEDDKGCPPGFTHGIHCAHGLSKLPRTCISGNEMIGLHDERMKVRLCSPHRSFNECASCYDLELTAIPSLKANFSGKAARLSDSHNEVCPSVASSICPLRCSDAGIVGGLSR